MGKAISPGSGADDVGGGAGGVGVAGIGPDYFIKCPQCHKGYPGFQALKDHVESSHPPPPHLGGDDGVSQPTSPVGSPAPNTPAGAAPGGIYACSQCSTSFLHKDQLEKHELLHSPNAQVVSIVFLCNSEGATRKFSLLRSICKALPWWQVSKCMVICRPSSKFNTGCPQKYVRILILNINLVIDFRVLFYERNVVCCGLNRWHRSIFLCDSGTWFEQYKLILSDFYDVINQCWAFFFAEYLPDDGQKRPKHVGGLMYDCIFLYRTVVQLLE